MTTEELIQILTILQKERETLVTLRKEGFLHASDTTPRIEKITAQIDKLLGRFEGN